MSVSPASTIDVDAIRDLFYPVGSYWISDNSTNPGTTIGGTWEQVKDTFLLAAGDDFQAGATGGETDHILTTSEMPSHRHEGIFYKYTGVENVEVPSLEVYLDQGNLGYQLQYEGQSTGSGNQPLVTKTVGGGQPHNNMPPYKAVYVFRRIA